MIKTSVAFTASRSQPYLSDKVERAVCSKIAWLSSVQQLCNLIISIWYNIDIWIIQHIHSLVEFNALLKAEGDKINRQFHTNSVCRHCHVTLGVKQQNIFKIESSHLELILIKKVYVFVLSFFCIRLMRLRKQYAFSGLRRLSQSVGMIRQNETNRVISSDESRPCNEWKW